MARQAAHPEVVRGWPGLYRDSPFPTVTDHRVGGSSYNGNTWLCLTDVDQVPHRQRPVDHGIETAEQGQIEPYTDDAQD